MPGYGRAGAWQHGQNPYAVPGAKPGRFPYPIVRERDQDRPPQFVITEAERNIYMADFESIDTSGNGFIEDAEIAALLAKQLGRDATEEETRALLARFDRDQDGQISFEEYMTVTMCVGKQG